MKNRVAIVTGGTRGIGKAIAVDLKRAGCKVAATYHGNDEAAQLFKKETGIAIYKSDVSNFKECQDMVTKIEADLGSVAILINNAGITRDGFLHKMTEDNWDAVLDTNLKSLFNMCRAVIEGMRARSYGRIITISSVNGQLGQFGQTNYSAAKAGVFGFTKSLARECAAKGITVNAVAPGYIETDMVKAVSEDVMKKIVAQIPVGRLGDPKEIARAVCFLAADEAGFITGETLSVNGGQHME
ncbi:MAG: acetoacetyl-CoA reductase [Rickettsiales bacterium]|jgi:acetoacetyl-CoA reductase|nr:acetoacetyl-CoA reductase [Rickettsiales bacterium]